MLPCFYGVVCCETDAAQRCTIPAGVAHGTFKSYKLHKLQLQTARAVAVQIGLSAPQGSGKSTIVSELELLLEHEGLRCAVVSIDDFYLTHTELTALGEAHKGNWLLQGRGHAGTHDLALGTQTLKDLITSTCASSQCKIADS
jgi:pantothenate kinase-related protein Tda10